MTVCLHGIDLPFSSQTPTGRSTVGYRQRDRTSTMGLFSCASGSTSDIAIHCHNKAANAL
jgi:hypothetical protein